MVRRRQRERSVWEVVLPDADKLWPAALRQIDHLIDDEALVEVIAEALERRWPQSRRRGRPGTPAEVVLRMLVLKHLYRWSYAELEHEVRSNLVYRAFARISCDVTPDAKTILKIARALGPDVIAQLHQRVVALAIAAGVTKGRRMRVDTTVVETHIHYPTDSSLLADGVRVVTRTLKRLETLVGRGRRGGPGSIAECHASAAGDPVRSAESEDARSPGAQLSTVAGDHTGRRPRGGHDDAAGRPPALRGRCGHAPADHPAADAPAHDAAAGASRDRANEGAGLPGRYPRPGQSRESVRTAHDPDSQRQAGQAHGVRPPRDDSRGRGPDHHRV